MFKRLSTAIPAALGMLLLIIDAQTALTGASEGVSLCIRVIIPSLFPFFILSVLLTGSLTGMSCRILRPIGRLCGIPAGGEALLLVGLLGGYPSGAQAVMQTLQTGQINRQDARRLLGFCSNAGPAFLFGMVASRFPSSHVAWLLWAIHVLSALIAGALLPCKSSGSIVLRTGSAPSLANAVERSIRSIASVCGWVVVFRIILAFCSRWFMWLFPKTVQVVFGAVLELANGCLLLDQIANSGLRFVICSAALAFGGVCVLMQTLSVTGALGLGWYLPGKLLQSAISILLAVVCQLFYFPPGERMEVSPLLPISLICILLISAIFLQKHENYSRNPAGIGV